MVETVYFGCETLLSTLQQGFLVVEMFLIGFRGIFITETMIERSQP